MPPGNVLFRHTPQAICWLNSSAGIIATTLAFDRLLPEGAAALFTAGTGTTWNAFWNLLQLSGTGTAEVERPVAGQGAIVLQLSGEVLQVEGETYTCLLCTDVTQLREDANRLTGSFRQIVQEFPVMIYGLDADHRFVVWNEQCERTTGYFKGEILPDPQALGKLYPDAAAVTAILNRIAATSEYTEYEAGPITHVFKNKYRRTISWIYRLNRTLLEEVRIWAIGIDLTEAYEAASALTRNEERFRAISQATNDVLWDWDLQTDMVWWGSGMSRIFGHGVSQTTSHIHWWVEHMHPSDRERVVSRIKDYIDRREELWLDEYQFRRADNSYASVLDKGRIIVNEKGRPIRMVGGIRDITDLKIALEKIQLRDRQLAEVSFYNSHKVREPLARLMGLVHLLRMDRDTPYEELVQLLDNIRSSAEELDYLIKNINHILH